MFKVTITPKEIESLEHVSFGGRIVVVDRIDEVFDRAVEYLKRQPIIGFDTEARPSFSPSQPSYGTSLLQLSGPDEAFLFRLKYIGLPRPLVDILADENILKIGAATVDDAKGLQRYSSFTPRGFVDLQKIVGEWGIYDKSVKKMAAIILGVRISKSQQLSNWEAEYLTPAQQHYAATDAWICLEMYRELQRHEKHPLTPEQLSLLSGIPLENILHPKVKTPPPPPKPKMSASAKRRARRKRRKQSNNDKGNTQEG